MWGHIASGKEAGTKIQRVSSVQWLNASFPFTTTPALPPQTVNKGTCSLPHSLPTHHTGEDTEVLQACCFIICGVRIKATAKGLENYMYVKSLVQSLNIYWATLWYIPNQWSPRHRSGRHSLILITVRLLKNIFLKLILATGTINLVLQSNALFINCSDQELMGQDLKTQCGFLNEVELHTHNPIHFIIVITKLRQSK